MPIAVELTFDGKTADDIRKLWRLIDKQHLSHHHPDFESAPHITLGVYDDSAEGVLVKFARQFAAQQGPYGLTFSSLGVFKGRDNTLFLAPRVDEELLHIHRLWHAVSRDVSLPHFSHYSHDQWEPHVTLGIDLNTKQFVRTFQAIADHPLPKHGTLMGVRLVKFSPTKVLADIPLGETYIEITHN